MEQAMSVTVERMTVLNPEMGSIKAFADIVLGGKYVVKGFRVMAGTNSVFVSMPAVLKEGKWQETFKPITKEDGHALLKSVMDAYETAIKAQTTLEGGR